MLNRTVLVYSGIFTFLVDAYPTYSASALAANSFARSTFAGIFPLFGTQSESGSQIPWLVADTYALASNGSVQSIGDALGFMPPRISHMSDVAISVSSVSSAQVQDIGLNLYDRYIFYRYGAQIRKKSRFAA